MSFLAQRLLRPFCRYQISPTTISIRQDGKWVDLARSEITTVKIVSVSRAIVRVYGSRRHVLNLYRFSVSAFGSITRALRNATSQNREIQALWRHTKAFRSRFIEPWHSLADESPAHARGLVAELQRELAPTHPLFNQTVAAIARRYDDVLFYWGESPGHYAVVHFTWTGKQERWPSWPETELFDSFDVFVEQRMKVDANECRGATSAR